MLINIENIKSTLLLEIFKNIRQESYTAQIILIINPPSYYYFIEASKRSEANLKASISNIP